MTDDHTIPPQVRAAVRRIADRLPLHTSRTLLRPVTPEDFPAVHAYRSLPERALYLGHLPLTEAGARELVGGWLADASSLQVGGRGPTGACRAPRLAGSGSGDRDGPRAGGTTSRGRCWRTSGRSEHDARPVAAQRPSGRERAGARSSAFLAGRGRVGSLLWTTW